MEDWKTEYFECSCHSDEHTLKFFLDPDPEYPMFYTSVFLYDYRGFWGRLIAGLKYIFGYKSKEGHWDSFLLKVEDADRMIELLHGYKKIVEERERILEYQARKKENRTTEEILKSAVEMATGKSIEWLRNTPIDEAREYFKKNLVK